MTIQRDPARFRAEYDLGGGQRRWPGEALGAGLALAALLLGVPALLLWLDGVPGLPHGSFGSALTERLGTEQVLSVLVVIAWLAWLQFAVCAAVEVAAALRGGVLARPVPFSGPSQRLARALVGSLLLATSMAVSVSAAQAAVSVPRSAAAAVPPAGPVASAAMSVAAARSPAGRVSEQADAVDATVPDTLLDAEDPDADLVGRRVYVVHPPQGRHHDSLWEIADRHLGDGRRYREIFELNRGRSQPDGEDLHLARLIQPGWKLVMPEDATGVPRYRAVSRRVDPPAAPTPAAAPTTEAAAPTSEAAAPTSEAAAPTSEAAAPTPAAAPTQAAAPTTPAPTTEAAQPAAAAPASATTTAAPARTTEAPAPSTQAADQSRGAAAVDPAPGQVDDLGAGWQIDTPAQRELVGAGMLAASLLAGLALIRRRRRGGSDPDTDAAETEVQLRVAATGDRGALLELAVRSLATSCIAAGRPLPQAHSAIVEDEAIDLLLTVPQAGPPQPWVVVDGGARWRLPREVAGGLPAEGESAYPLLVGVGRDEQGRDVLLNLGAATGPVTVAGDPATAAGAVRAMALGLAANPWSRGIDVLATGLPDQLPVLSAGRITPCEDNPQLVDRLLADGAPPPRTTAQLLGGAPVPGGRPERVAVFGAGLDDATGERVRSASAHRSDLAVLAVGDGKQAGWRLQAGPDGRLTCPELGLDVVAHRLADETVEQLRALFETATRPPVNPGGEDDPHPDPGGEDEDVEPVPAATDSGGAPGVQPIPVRHLAPAAIESPAPAAPSPKSGSAPEPPAAEHPFDPGPELRPPRPATTGDVPIEAHNEPVFRPAPRGRRAGTPRPIAPAPMPDPGPDDEVWAAAPARVALLGEVEVRATGPLAVAHQAMAEETVAFLALHRAGVHPSVLGAALWPLGVTPDVRRETIELVREWLGPDPDGAPLLREGHDSRLRLSARMPCDWDVLRTLVGRVEDGLPRDAERDLLARGLRLVRGPVAGGVAIYGYSWLPRTGVQRQADGLIIRSAGRLAALCAEDGDQVGVARAAAAGLQAVPTEQGLWRHVIRAEHALGGADRLATVLEQMRFTLSTMGVDLEPKTAALVQHLGQTPPARRPA